MMIHGFVAMLDLVHCDTLLVAVDLFFKFYVNIFCSTAFSQLTWKSAYFIFRFVFVVFLCNVHNVRIDVAHS